MDTAIYSFCLLLMIYALADEWQPRLIFLFLLMLSLIRPEGPAYAIPVSVYYTLHKKYPCQRVVKSLLLYFILPFGLFLLCRYLYFGTFLPNTFYAKHDFRGWILLQRGVFYILTFFQPRPLYFIALLWLALEKPDLRNICLLLWLFLLTQIGVVILEGGDHFALHRFLVPVLPLLAIGTTRGFQRLMELYLLSQFNHLNTHKKIIIHVASVFPVLIILCAHSVQLFEYKANDRYHFSNGAYWHFDEVNWARGWARIGNWLQEKYPPTTRIAVITAGAIPFYSRLPAIDLVGLNTRAIARSEFPAASTQYTGHEKANAEYVLQQEPQFIQLFPMLMFSSTPYPEEKLEEMVQYPAQKELWHHPQFFEKYRYTTEETPYGIISYFELRNQKNE